MSQKVFSKTILESGASNDLRTPTNNFKDKRETSVSTGRRRRLEGGGGLPGSHKDVLRILPMHT